MFWLKSNVNWPYYISLLDDIVVSPNTTKINFPVKYYTILKNIQVNFTEETILHLNPNA